jgi:Asp-tRNA(Asn)/Glu-tRNA(Gln) amidotransferase A subunit family amidase
MTKTAELAKLGAGGLRELFGRHEASPVEVVDALLTRIAAVDPRLSAFISLYGDEARASARHCERLYMADDPAPPLCGIPIAIKDSEAIAGQPTSFGVPALANYVPASSSVQADRVIQAGAIPLGKTSLPPLGYAGLTDNSLVGATSTPYRIGYNSGGSSGGSAAAVGAELVPLAVGSDGGGSLRIPASLCGVVGFKATFGVIPSGSYGDSFSAHNPFMLCGPLARTVSDVRLLLLVMQGVHPLDPFSVPADTVSWQADGPGINGLRIAYSPSLGGGPVHREVADTVKNTALELAHAGAHVEEVELSLGASPEAIGACWRLVSGLGQRLGIQRLQDAGFDPLSDPGALPSELIEDVEAATRLTTRDLQLAEDTRSRLLAAIESTLSAFDLIITPTLSVDGVQNASAGFTRGPSDIDGVPVDPFFGWVHTPVFNFTGHPAASVPAGLSSRGLPIGAQIAGRRFDDGVVLRACETVEAFRADGHNARPGHQEGSVWALDG